jgi:osomolarity two-component system sensor histidine kinase NIK1
LLHCSTYGCTTPVIAIPDTVTVTTPPVFSSETEELHLLHMELQLLKVQVQDVAHVYNAVAGGDLSKKCIHDN